MRVRKAIVSVVLAGSMIPALMGQSAKNGAVGIYIERARTQDAQGRHDLASAKWKQVLLLSPRQPEALAALARFYRDAGDSTTANMYQERLKAAGAPLAASSPRAASSADDKSTLEQAVKLSQQHKYREALNLYRKVLGDNPTFGDWAVVYYDTQAAIPGANPTYALALSKSIAETTVNFHIKNLVEKLQANDRTHAVTIAARRGLLEI